MAPWAVCAVDTMLWMFMVFSPLVYCRGSNDEACHEASTQGHTEQSLLQRHFQTAASVSPDILVNDSAVEEAGLSHLAGEHSLSTALENITKPAHRENQSFSGADSLTNGDKFVTEDVVASVAQGESSAGNSTHGEEVGPPLEAPLGAPLKEEGARRRAAHRRRSKLIRRRRSSSNSTEPVTRRRRDITRRRRILARRRRVVTSTTAPPTTTREPPGPDSPAPDPKPVPTPKPDTRRRRVITRRRRIPTRRRRVVTSTTAPSTTTPSPGPDYSPAPVPNPVPTPKPVPRRRRIITRRRRKKTRRRRVVTSTTTPPTTPPAPPTPSPGPAPGPAPEPPSTRMVTMTTVQTTTSEPETTSTTMIPTTTTMTTTTLTTTTLTTTLTTTMTTTTLTTTTFTTTTLTTTMTTTTETTTILTTTTLTTTMTTTTETTTTLTTTTLTTTITTTMATTTVTITSTLTTTPIVDASTTTLGSCLPSQKSRTGPGWGDIYKGWYDVQGCGQCNDYCRWVGGARPGGDPSKSVKEGNGWWSCRLAGSDQPYTWGGHFKSFKYTRCVKEGGSVPKPGECLPVVSKVAHTGYLDVFRGWYDVQGCGHCNEYCRWVGGSGAGGDPKKQVVKDKSWWACHMGGRDYEYTSKDYFTSFNFQKCEKQGVPTPTPGTCLPPINYTHPGYPDDFKGWYDVQGCGTCNDFCRWVGGSGTGGDPQDKVQYLDQPGAVASWWSCSMGGADTEYTLKDHFTEFNFQKCDGKGAKASSCLVPIKHHHPGYSDIYRGWYDVQGCGKCNDYCRWVGSSGAGGDPKKRTAKDGSWWSCALAGNASEYTTQGHFKSFDFRRCLKKGAAPPKPGECFPPLTRSDDGYPDEYRGWYDVQGCGHCNDFCRWVGGSGSGGDPIWNVTKDASWWSCRIGGTDLAYTGKGFFANPSFNLAKCAKEGDPTPEPSTRVPPPTPAPGACWPPPKKPAEGYFDSYRGWYDVQECGKCNDYCRWVGGSGPGGDPMTSVTKDKSWWSCHMGNDPTVPYTPDGNFNSFMYPKCAGRGAPTPPPAPPKQPYKPGEAGAPWSEEEMMIVRAKVQRMLEEGGSVAWEVGLNKHDPEWWNELPNPAKVLRLGFHHCIRYKDGTGGCNGCLEWNGVGTRYKRSDLTKGKLNNAGNEDGHNNGLTLTVQLLEHIYTDRAFPQRTPVLPRSLLESGKSRADLWAFATLVVVEYTIRLNNVHCVEQDFKNLSNKQCHPRFGEPDCLVEQPRPFSFQTGRRDCVSDGHPWASDKKKHSYMTAKKELHPDPHANGTATLTFFKNEFNFNGRETVAIMGGHTLGRLHVVHSLLRYTWKCRSGSLFNNGYFRNIAAKEDWLYSSNLLHLPCAQGGVANAEGQRPIARWVTLIRGDMPNGGPSQWIQEKKVCPVCSVLKQKFDGVKTPGGESMPVFGNKAFFYKCCLGLPSTATEADASKVSKFVPCKKECERWEFIPGLDETALNAEMGLYKSFQVDSGGIPKGCKGFEKYNMETWDGFNPNPPYGMKNGWAQWSWIDGQGIGEPECGYNKYSDPADDLPVYQIIEQYATDNKRFLADFFPTLEKMLANGYSDGDLIPAPRSGMTGFDCTIPSFKDAKRFYRCVKK